MSSLTFNHAAPGDIPAIAALLAEALSADAELRVFVEGTGRAGRLHRHLAAEAREILALGGVVDAACDPQGQLLAAAVWEQPGFHETLGQTLRHGPAKLEAVRLRGLLNWLRYRARFVQFRPPEPHWHLVRLGTGKPFRGRGIATALLEQRLAEIDRAGMAAHLESSSADSARLYARLGFVEVGEIALPGAVRVRAMTRPARES